MPKYVSAGKVALSTTISLHAYNRLARKRAETGTPIGDYIDNLIMDDNDVYTDVLDSQIKNLAFIEMNLKRKKAHAMKLYEKVKNLPKNSEDYVTVGSRESLWSDYDETMLDAISNAISCLRISFSKMNELGQKVEDEFTALIKPEEEKYKY